MDGRVVLLSIKPVYSDRIVSGEKRIEFRRSWAKESVDKIVIYATSPVKRIVAIAEIKKVHVGNRMRLWSLAKKLGGGVTRNNLYSYLTDKENAVGIELMNVQRLPQGLDPKLFFGASFRPPQSFQYLSIQDYLEIKKHSKACGQVEA